MDWSVFIFRFSPSHFHLPPLPLTPPLLPSLPPTLPTRNLKATPTTHTHIQLQNIKGWKIKYTINMPELSPYVEVFGDDDNRYQFLASDANEEKELRQLIQQRAREYHGNTDKYMDTQLTRLQDRHHFQDAIFAETKKKRERNRTPSRSMKKKPTKRQQQHRKTVSQQGPNRDAKNNTTMTHHHRQSSSSQKKRPSSALVMSRLPYQRGDYLRETSTRHRLAHTFSAAPRFPASVLGDSPATVGVLSEVSVVPGLSTPVVSLTSSSGSPYVRPKSSVQYRTPKKGKYFMPHESPLRKYIDDQPGPGSYFRTGGITPTQKAVVAPSVSFDSNVQRCASSTGEALLMASNAPTPSSVGPGTYYPKPAARPSSAVPRLYSMLSREDHKRGELLPEMMDPDLPGPGHFTPRDMKKARPLSARVVNVRIGTSCVSEEMAAQRQLRILSEAPGPGQYDVEDPWKHDNTHAVSMSGGRPKTSKGRNLSMREEMIEEMVARQRRRKLKTDDLTIVKRNIESVKSYAADVQIEREEKAIARAEHAEVVRERAEKQRQGAEDKLRRSMNRKDRIEDRRLVTYTQSQWLVQITHTSLLHRLNFVRNAHRTFIAQDCAARLIGRAWRKFRKKREAQSRSKRMRAIMGRHMFYFMMNRRIRKKREAANLLARFLIVSNESRGSVRQILLQFKHKVVVIQRFWRKSKKKIEAQTQLLSLQWLRYDAQHPTVAQNQLQSLKKRFAAKRNMGKVAERSQEKSKRTTRRLSVTMNKNVSRMQGLATAIKELSRFCDERDRLGKATRNAHAEGASDKKRKGTRTTAEVRRRQREERVRGSTRKAHFVSSSVRNELLRNHLRRVRTDHRLQVRKRAVRFDNYMKEIDSTAESEMEEIRLYLMGKSTRMNHLLAEAERTFDQHHPRPRFSLILGEEELKRLQTTAYTNEVDEYINGDKATIVQHRQLLQKVSNVNVAASAFRSIGTPRRSSRFSKMSPQAQRPSLRAGADGEEGRPAHKLSILSLKLQSIPVEGSSHRGPLLSARRGTTSRE